MKNITLTLCGLFLFSSCSVLDFNSVEAKLAYDEHYVTVNDIDYKSNESESYGVSITKRNPGPAGFAFDYDFFPDISFEQSELYTTDASLRASVANIKMRRISAFVGARGNFHTPIGTFDLSVAAGPSYVETYNDNFDTSTVEATFRYQAGYTAYVFKGIYTGVNFIFQESPNKTYSEYYSLVYKLGYTF